jgi:hypothetical protein
MFTPCSFFILQPPEMLADGAVVPGAGQLSLIDGSGQSDDAYRTQIPFGLSLGILYATMMQDTLRRL